MDRKKLTWTMASAACAAVALAMSSVALADVKAGVDAWSAGDYAKAVAEWRGPAGKGDPDALFNLAQAYRLGRGVPEDAKQAEALYARAAARGHLKAADNYGLLLFQDGRREQAVPYLTAAAERGDPRAQYLIGLAHFNGDLMPKDWVRAYALLTLANGAGLPQAAPAIRQMDEFVPLDQRQEAQLLAAKLRANADTTRSSQLAAADLGTAQIPDNAPPIQTALPPRRLPAPVASVAVPPSVVAAEAAVAEALRATGTESPADSGADFARAPLPKGPAVAAAPRPAREPAQTVAPRPAREPAKPAPVAAPAQSGPWKLQLGAFSVAGNADRAWAQVARSAALAGKVKQTAPAGRLTKLLASGWPSQAAAQSACATLKAGGHTCVVTR